MKVHELRAFIKEILTEARSEKQKIAVVQIEHKPTQTIFYSYTTKPGTHLQHVLKRRAEEEVKDDNDTVSNLLRKDPDVKNYTIDIVDLVDDVDKARTLAKQWNDQAGVKYKMGRRPKIKEVPTITLDKADSKSLSPLNDLFIIKKSALSDPKYKDLEVDKTQTYTFGNDTYYKVLSLNVERK